MKTGVNVRISDKVSIHNPGALEIGDNVRIDDFVVLSCGAGLKIGSNIHIGCHGMYYAGAGIELHDYSEYAPGVVIMSTCDDFSGNSLVGPCLPDDLKPGLQRAKVIIERHVTFGVYAVVMPGVTIGAGCAVGAYTLVRRDLDPWGIYAGIPARRVGERNKKRMLQLEQMHRGGIRAAYDKWSEVCDGAGGA